MEIRSFVSEVKKELENRGHVVDTVEVNKNGVVYHGVCLGNGQVRANIYIDSYFEDGLSVSETADKVVSMDKDCMSECPISDDILRNALDSDFIKEHVTIELSKADTYKEYLTRQENDFTLTLVIHLTDEAKARVTKSFLNSIDFSEDELWEIAKANSEKDVSVKGMSEVMIEMMGAEQAEVLGLVAPSDEQMLVVTNHRKYHGAYAVFTDTAKAEIKRRLDTDKVVILPSSIHEVIVVPYKDDCMDTFSNMVKEVNATQVASEEQLSDTPLLMAI